MLNEIDRLRADNARLKAEVESEKMMRELDKTVLQAHKQALEQARVLIRECRLVIDCFAEGHDISARNMIDNAVEHCDEFEAGLVAQQKPASDESKAGPTL